LAKPKVKLDPGHGGSDPGASAHGLVEKHMTLVTAFAAKEELEAHGVEVSMTRTTDVYIDLSKRAQMANDWDADLFVSIHYNAGGGDGAEAIHSVAGGVSKSLAENIVESVKEELGQNLRPRAVYSRANSRGKDYYAVIRETKMPSVIIEPAFVDSNDRFMFDTVEEQRKAGVAIAHGILKQLGIPIKSKKATPVQESQKPTPASKPTPKPASQTKKVGTVTADVLNVRKGPGTNYDVITTLKKGTKIEIATESNGWYKTPISGPKYGYVSAKYVVNGKVVNCEVLNVRSGAGTEHKVIGTLKKGTSVKVIESKNGWHKILLEPAKCGWVSKKYVK
jgi:N-acetylmuramoyl-L-alanine amidase